MATAIVIPAVASLISGIAPQIPAIVQFVEGLFGHPSSGATPTATPTGEQKLQTAVTLLIQALTSLANAGKIPSAGVVDPSLPAALTGAVQAVVDALKASGGLPATQGAQTATAPAATPKPATLSGVLTGDRKVTVVIG